jgi:hypothetical protein
MHREHVVGSSKISMDARGRGAKHLDAFPAA